MNGAPASVLPRRPWLRWLRLAFVGATMAAAGIFLMRQQDALAAALDRSERSLLFAGLAIAIGNALFACWSWYALMWSHRGRLTPVPAMRLFFTSQLGKYLPGGFWPFIAAAELGRDAGFGQRAMIASFTVALVIGVGTGAGLAANALHCAISLPDGAQQWVWLAALPMLTLLLPPVRAAIARIASLDEVPSVGEIIASSLLAVIAWIFAGLHLLLLSAAIGASVDWSMLVNFTGIYAAAWVIGFLLMIAPAGFGPREAAMITLLSAIMPLADAALVSLLSRVGMTLADLLAAGLAFIAPRARVGQ